MSLDRCYYVLTLYWLVMHLSKDPIATECPFHGMNIVKTNALSSLSVRGVEAGSKHTIRKTPAT